MSHYVSGHMPPSVSGHYTTRCVASVWPMISARQGSTVPLGGSCGAAERASASDGPEEARGSMTNEFNSEGGSISPESVVSSFFCFLLMARSWPAVHYCHMASVQFLQTEHEPPCFPCIHCTFYKACDLPSCQTRGYSGETRSVSGQPPSEYSQEPFQPI